jgi:uncharacterized protein YdaU (DUF1376 family)
MSQAPYMPTWIGDLMAKTLHLGGEEFGSYHFLMYAIWQNNGLPLPDDDRKLARICRMSLKRWRQVMRHVMVEFFDIVDGEWHQRRLEREWNFMCQKRQKLRANGAMGGRPKTNPKPLEIHERGKPNGSDLVTQMPSHSESDSKSSDSLKAKSEPLTVETAPFEREEGASLASPEGPRDAPPPTEAEREAAAEAEHERWRAERAAETQRLIEQRENLREEAKWREEERLKQHRADAEIIRQVQIEAAKRRMLFDLPTPKADA